MIFAYTIKGWGLPIAGHPMNHSALLTGEQIDELRAGARPIPRDEWAASTRRRRRARSAPASAERLTRARRTGRASRSPATPIPAELGPTPHARDDVAGGVRPHAASTSRAYEDVARAHRHDLARRRRSRPTSAAGSTSVGVFAPTAERRVRGRRGRACCAGTPGPDRPAHRARHLRDEPVPDAGPARPRVRSCTDSSCCRSARSTTRSSAAGWTRSSTALLRREVRRSRARRRASRCRARAARTSRAITPSIGIELPEPALLRAVLRARGRVDPARRDAPHAATASTASRRTCGSRRRRSSQAAVRRPAGAAGAGGGAGRRAVGRVPPGGGAGRSRPVALS